MNNNLFKASLLTQNKSGLSSYRKNVYTLNLIFIECF